MNERDKAASVPGHAEMLIRGEPRGAIVYEWEDNGPHPTLDVWLDVDAGGLVSLSQGTDLIMMPPEAAEQVAYAILARVQSWRGSHDSGA